MVTKNSFSVGTWVDEPLPGSVIELKSTVVPGGYVAKTFRGMWEVYRADDSALVIRLDRSRVDRQTDLLTSASLQFVMDVFEAGMMKAVTG